MAVRHQRKMGICSFCRKSLICSRDIKLSAGMKTNQGEVDRDDIKLLQDRLERATEELKKLSLKNSEYLLLLS